MEPELQQQLVVDAEGNGQRLDSWLASRLDIARSRVRRWIDRDGVVRVFVGNRRGGRGGRGVGGGGGVGGGI